MMFGQCLGKAHLKIHAWEEGFLFSSFFSVAILPLYNLWQCFSTRLYRPGTSARGRAGNPSLYVCWEDRSLDEVVTMSSVLVSSKPDSGCERTRKQGAAGGKRCLQAAAVRWHWRRWMAERQVRHKELGFSWRWTGSRIPTCFICDNALKSRQRAWEIIVLTINIGRTSDFCDKLKLFRIKEAGVRYIAKDFPLCILLGTPPWYSLSKVNYQIMWKLKWLIQGDFQERESDYVYVYGNLE